MANIRKKLGFLLCLLTIGHVEIDVALAQQMISVTAAEADGSEAVIVGRIHVEAQDGGMMLEDRSGRIHSLLPAAIVNRQPVEDQFTYFTADELSAQLLKRHGVSFSMNETDHFLLCSDASEIYTDYCGRLLESVLTRYRAFFEDSEIPLTPLTSKLQVVIFRNPTTFSEFAKQQHPETDFSDVPGYYSIRDNQMLVTAVSGDRQFRRDSELITELKKNRRQVETLVHEVVHQLAFNTGLQVRYAANPMWLSEGLAVYFESTSGRGPLAWTRQGETSRVHLPTLKRINKSAPMPISLAMLLGDDSAFQVSEQAAFAYAESWALTHFLVSRRRESFDRLLLAYQQAVPLKSVSPEQQIERFVEATGFDLERATSSLRQHFGRMRVPR